MAADFAAGERLEQAIALLRRLVAQAGDAPDLPLTPWQEEYIPLAGAGEPVSATDRLSWWFRPASTTANPWDDYFDRPALAPRPGRPDTAPTTPSPAAPASAWTNLHLLLHEPEEDLPEDDAEAAVETLYDFVHALGRQDVAAAMQGVAEDYHTMEEDREIDRLGLRHQIESLLDSFHAWELDVSLVEIPRPVFHPHGILIYAEFQLDAWRSGEAARRSLLMRRMVVLEQQPDRRWLISALSQVSLET